MKISDKSDGTIAGYQDYRIRKHLLESMWFSSSVIYTAKYVESYLRHSLSSIDSSSTCVAVVIQSSDYPDIVLESFVLHDRSFSFANGALTFKVTYDSDSGVFSASNELLSLEVFALSCAELEHEIKEQIDLVWDEYVLTSEPLSREARELRERFLGLIEVHEAG